MKSFGDPLEEALTLLGEVLEASGAAPLRLVVAGGAALRAGRWVTRVTRDVDVIARRSEVDGEILSAWPLDEGLRVAVAQVAAELRLPENWLNASAALVMVPLEELPGRVWSGGVTRAYGSRLRIEFVGREGLIDLKLHAALNPERRHDVADLKALSPSKGEFAVARGWLESSGLLDANQRQQLESLHHELFDEND